MVKPNAEWIDCEGRTGKLEHAMRDYCWTCAPFWGLFPVCPTDHTKLAQSGYCRQCRKFYTLTNKPVAA